MSDWLDSSQVCCCDTDSVMFLYDKSKPSHKEPDNENKSLPKGLRSGKGLGEWEDETDEDDCIRVTPIGPTRVRSL